MVCPVSFHLNGECELHALEIDYRLKYPLSHHCCQIAISHSQRLILMTPSTATRQACVSVNNPPLRGHLSAVAVVKFNESRRDSVSSVCTAAGQRSVGCSSVDAIWAAAA